MSLPSYAQFLDEEGNVVASRFINCGWFTFDGMEADLLYDIAHGYLEYDEEIIERAKARGDQFGLPDVNSWHTLEMYGESYSKDEVCAWYTLGCSQHAKRHKDYIVDLEE